MELLALALPLAGGFGLGLASTLHCAGMCGGLAASLLHLGAPRSPGDGLRLAAVTHTGRILAYVAAGALVGAMGAPAIGWLDREVAFRLAQWAGAVALMWIGLSTAGLLPPLSVLDRVLAPVANTVARTAVPLPGRFATALVGGMAWGLMPCAMVYGALFTAMLSGSALGGGAVMTAFGIGTLPGLVAATAGFGTLAVLGSRPRQRRIAGLAIGVLGFMTVWVPHSKIEAICAPSQAATLTQVNIRP
ncbi:sulfite exporter TauE/SafE family protein [Hyphomicrobium sp.]|uniref:sulfite exporter TauE/SafE family protein n=1 Tax=Hyphomicrobium sp. TaxID=82 RepID=UPI0025BB772D|nr:sulfite exporter TauE/SafE family protein [Hyphomicrobium sp.]MCC7253862.1 sulfite exporter TauE/SafE family protein [Hyphomicrobium sp.]